jgi:hypothetical protein
LSKSAKSGRKHFLLIGNSGAGKSCLFCQVFFYIIIIIIIIIKIKIIKLIFSVQLVYKKQFSVQTSIKPNIGIAKIEDKSKVKNAILIDIPGSDRIRQKFINIYKKTTKYYNYLNHF